VVAAGAAGHGIAGGVGAGNNRSRDYLRLSDHVRNFTIKDFLMDYRGQSSLPRGIRDNNPGNLQPPPGLTGWQGTVGMDGPFVIFADDTWGLRALALDITNKINTDGLDTITALITAYAPPSENDTAAYIAAVAADSGIGATDQLGTDQDTITSLMRAIINHENGDAASAQYVPDADILTGYNMANNIGTAFNAAVIAAQAYPTQTVLVVGAIAAGLWLVFRKKK
jgi:hypothetical protein